jgi:hypothetical protein
MSKKRKYDDNYVSYGFTCINERDGTQQSQCFCAEIFLRTEVKLKEPLVSVHPENTPNDAILFCSKKSQSENAGTFPKRWIVISR